MAFEKMSSPENKVSLEYTKIADDAISKKVTLVDELRGVLRELKLPISDFSEFLDSFLTSKSIDESSLIAVSYGRKTFSIYTQNWDYNFSINEFKSFLIEKALGGHDRELTEKRAKNLRLAIESIFAANDKLIFDGEINNEVLRQGLQVFAGIWWVYEWWAKYFSLSREEIDHKVENLLASMWDINEVFDYIKSINADIKNNFKKSDMVNQVNGKLIQSLYTQTFNRLKSTNAPNKDFIEFAKILTGRWEILRWKNGDYKYGKLKMEKKWKDYQMANEAIVYTMLREGWVLDNITNKIEVRDPNMGKADTPKSIIESSISVFNNLAKKVGKSWEDLANELWFWETLLIKWEQYEDLDFEEKVRLWALMRTTSLLKYVSLEDLQKDPNLITKEIQDSEEDAYRDINGDLSDNFDGWGWWFGWKDAADMWLSGDLAEVFNLYQDMNGNEWIFDLSDKTKDMFTPTLRGALALWASIAVACVILATLPASASVLAIMAAWAAAWAATWLITSALWDQGYDTYKEAAIDTASIVATDAAVWALFFLWSIKFFKWVLNEDILAAPFLSRLTLADAVAFGGTETVVNSMFTTPIISSKVKQSHPENHFDTDKD